MWPRRVKIEGRGQGLFRKCPGAYKNFLYLPGRNQTGGTGVSPVPARAFPCGYRKYLLEANLCIKTYWGATRRVAPQLLMSRTGSLPALPLYPPEEKLASLFSR
jgi:hypothetical protein